MRADDRALADIAISVADGAPIDWNTAESHLSARERRLARHLRLVESIAELHRSIPPESAAGTEIVADTPVAPGAVTWGRLLLLDRIGEGMSGEVYRARDTELHREVALKLLHHEGPAGSAKTQDAHRRVLDEARRLARIRHPHVVHVYGAEQHDNRVGLWMELVQGESLEHIVKTRGPLGAKEAAMVGLDLCAALAAVHGAGLLHRDVKAQNVMREGGGRIVLMDFGTGEELRENAGSNRMVGTPLYLAPEMFRGKAATAQSDIYSLGVLLFYIVTGEFPVIATSMIALGKAHAQGQRRRLRDLRPDLPAAFVGVVERALEQDPAARFSTVGDLEAALQRSIDRVADVPAPAPVAVPAPSRTRAFAFAGLAAALLLAIVALIVWTRAGGDAGTGIRTLAILPMSEVEGSAAPEFFADGLTDQLISTVGRIHALRVTSWSSVARYKGSSAPPAQIASELGADAAVEMTVLVAGSGSGGGPARVKVNARLISASSREQLWHGTFDRPMGEMFALQSAFALDIANALNVAITPSEARGLGQTRTTSPEAEQAFFQGRLNLSQFGSQSASRALDAFARAIKLDPDHAAAHAGAARAYYRLAIAGVLPQPEARALAVAQAERALALDDGLADAHATMGDLRFYYDWDWAGAEKWYQRGLDADSTSTYARTQYAQLLAASGRIDEGVEQASTAANLDPLAADALRIHGLMLFYKRDYAAADAVVRRSLDLEQNSAGAWVILSRIAEAQGRLDGSEAAIGKAIDLSDGAPPALRTQQIRLQAMRGNAAEARIALAQLEREHADRKLRLAPQLAAYVLLALGEREAALDRLEEAIGLREPTVLWMAVDPRLDAVRTHPRYEALVRRLGVPTP